MNHEIEIFSAGCTYCTKAIDMVNSIADDKDEVIILDMSEPVVTNRAIELRIQSVPTIFIDGEIAGRCSSRGPDRKIIQSALSH